MPSSLTWTLGLGYDMYDGATRDFEQLSPKLGVQWHLTEMLRLRAAVVRSVKPALLANQTIQPTQVAGFNQFFDDINGTRSWLYGLGADAQLSDKLYSGIQVTRRDLDEATQDSGRTITEKANETGARAYLYLALTGAWAMTGELIYDLYERDKSVSDLPRQVTTYALPVGIRYFNPSGIFAGLGTTLVYQSVERRPGTGFPEGDDTFYVVDAATGYRFPHRRGLISLEVQNLLDHDFNYQDDSYRKSGNDPAISPFIPDQTILGLVTLVF